MLILNTQLKQIRAEDKTANINTTPRCDPRKRRHSSLFTSSGSLARINQKRLFAVLSTTKFKSQKFVSLTDNGSETATAVQRPRPTRQNRKHFPKTLLTHSPALVTSSSSTRHASSRTLLLVLGPVSHTRRSLSTRLPLG